MASTKNAPRSTKPSPPDIEGNGRDIAPEGVNTPPETPVAPEEAPAEIVVLQKVVDASGNVEIKVIPQGVTPLEVQTIIELGVTAWRKQIGLS